ncbi:glycosyltransferase family 4 protein [Sphingomonas rosea]|uniref:Glycosyltransferase family 4 protein n=1 Tax=Sphingomonas rosea TaxID=335605 RepID=A0ABP7UCR0_9SPHN
MARILYLSYDGLTDPLGPSQVLAYLKGLAALGHQISLITFEKPERPATDRLAMTSECAAAGIDWHPLAYTKRPPVLSTLKDLTAMHRTADRLVRERGYDIVHCRSAIPALVGARLKRRRGLRFIFDMRGFWADERVEGGLWDLGKPLYRAMFGWFKKQESRLLRTADVVVVLTEAARDILRGNGSVPATVPIAVIPCCADLGAFPPITDQARADARAGLGIAGEATVPAYLGSIGTWYMLGEMLDCFAVLRTRDPDAVMLFVTRDDPAPILAAAAARGIPAEALRIRPASRAEVPQLLAAADFGLFFIRPTYSKQASSPVKLGELFAMNLPVLANGGVGDMDRILAQSGAGVAVERFDPAAYGAALDALAALRPDPARWRATLVKWFDLDRGIAAYDGIYRALAPATERNSDTSRGA